MSNPPFGASYVDGFSDYIVSTYETPVVYIVIVCLLVTFSIVIVAPIACLGQDLARRNKVADDSTYNNKHATHPSDNNNGITLPHHNHGNTTATTASSVVDSNPLSPHSTGTTVSHNHDLKESVFHKIEYPQQHRQHQHPPAPEQYRAPHNVADIRIFHGELLAAMKVMATERRFASQPQMCHASSGTAQPQQYPASYPQIFPSTPRFFDRSGSFNFKHNSKNNHQTNSERLSAIPSVATTSRLHIPRPRPHNHSGGADKKRPLRSRMPWSHNRPIPRTDTIQRSVWKERQSQMMNHQGNLLSASGDHYNNNNNNHLDGNGSISQNDGGGSRFSRSSWGADGQAIALRKPRAISGAAGTYLDDEAVDGEFEFYRKRYLEQHHQVQKARQHQQKATRTPSISGNSFSDMGSVMPPLSSSVLAPHDAADANDPGRIPNPMKYRSTTISPTGEYMKVSGDSLSSHLSTALSHLIDLAEHNYESQRIVSLAIVPTISAMAEPLFRMVLVAIISNYIDTDSMVAYVLVILFIRITTMEISGAISDAESNMLQDAFIVHGSGDIGFYHAGQTMQLAIFFQLVIGLPVLLMWYFTMDDVVQWLVDDSRIADIASTYSGVIIIDYLVRSASRSFMLPFHLLGHGHFEKYVDIIATILTVVAIAIVAASNDLSLTAIGWIQVIIGIAKFSTKVAYVVLRGWFAPYRDGLLKSWACKSTGSVVAFLLQAFPLFLGSLLELGEWEVLIFCVSYLGGAEVATWAVMGVIWEVFQAMTEGIGEAASVRVSFYLTEGLPNDARKLAHKIAFLSIVLVLLFTSIFLMAGPNIAATLTTDNTLQHLLTDLIGATALANISMTFAQVYWSLAGAQGRFGFASATILLCRWLVTLPIAFICIFGHEFDLTSVACGIAVGYAIAACILACTVFSSDWEQLAYFLRDDIDPYGAFDFYDDGAGIVDEGEDEDESFDDDDDESADDDSVLEEGENESSSRTDDVNNIL